MQLASRAAGAASCLGGATRPAADPQRRLVAVAEHELDAGELLVARVRHEAPAGGESESDRDLARP